MRRSIIIVVSLLLLSPLILSNSQAANQPNSDIGVGRFLLMQGYYKTPTKLKDGTVIISEEKAVLKIDTKTGQSWVLYTSRTPEEYKIMWWPIKDRE